MNAARAAQSAPFSRPETENVALFGVKLFGAILSRSWGFREKAHDAVNRAKDPELRPTSRRLENFSDAVFAIVVTIMVFEIRIPDGLAFGMDRAAAQQFIGLLFTYAMSFFVIVNLWTSHHFLIFTIDYPTRTTIWLNNLLLFCATLLPVTTRFLGLHPASSQAAAAYGLLGVVATATFMLLRSHAARIAHEEEHRRIHRRVLQLTWVFLGVYSASIPLAFVSPWLAWACFVAVPPGVFFLPNLWAKSDRRTSGADHGALERSCP